ncbi:hypothetical protein [Solidesulfovibrio sp.]|uniref:hypothetical protein n=1 Tax=Solidesulfovibrio sp. TaxID=2910990 RepID=UPI002B21B556|nr:hypothetical protein [Solidesulfovibrio sp.]MEA5089612.1 hypothetical protein [Solidesulfovibrio sp.]
MNTSSSAWPVKVRRARVNNLKSIDLKIEQGKLYVLTGPSGSGKSSLAFDVIYAEADRLGRASGLHRVFRKDEPDYEVEGLPARVVGIEQQIVHQTMIESVGAYTGFIGQILGDGKRCPRCGGAGYIRDVDLDRLVKSQDKPVNRGAFSPPVKELAGLDKVRWDRFCAKEGISPKTPWKALPASAREMVLETGYDGFKGLAQALRRVAAHGAAGLPRTLAKNLGEEMDFYITNTVCPVCGGYGHLDADRKRIGSDDTLGSLLDRGLIGLAAHERRWFEKLSLRGLPVLHPLFGLSTTEARNLRFLTNILGLTEPSLVIFDEPAAGLLPWEAAKIADLFKDMRSFGHTILAMEHGREIVEAADEVVAFGPGAGSEGGQVVFQGPPQKFLDGPLNPYDTKAMAGMARRSMPADKAPATTRISRERRGPRGRHIRASAPRSPASQGDHHLQATFRHWYGFTDFAIDIPLGRLVCVCGPSGSGKTAYLQAAFASCDKTPTGWQGRTDLADRYGCDRIRRPYLITPEPIGKHAGSTPATYIGVWDRIRDLYAELPEAKRHHLDKSSFSFNTPKGQCPRCHGYGYLSDNHIQFTECPECHGTRFNPKVKAVTFGGVDIAAVNCLTVSDSHRKFRERLAIAHYLEFMEATALGYLVLGQPSNSLSGGEAQRVKIAAKLCRRLGDRSMYILDNPCRGIGSRAVPQLFDALQRLVAKNNTVLIAENTEEVARSCDWLVILDSPKNGRDGRTLEVRYAGPGNKRPDDPWRGKSTARGRRS